jgi:hypothetical protein
MQLREIMSRPAHCAAPEDTLVDAALTCRASSPAKS